MSLKQRSLLAACLLVTGLLAACLLVTGLGLGCSPQPQPVKNAPPPPNGKGVPINKYNKSKVVEPLPDGPPPPPVR